MHQGLGASGPLSLLFSHSVGSDSLQPHGLQHTGLPYPSTSPGVCPNSCPLNWWCHLTISPSATTVSSCLQSLPGSGSFPGSLRICWPKYWSFSISPCEEYSVLISFRIDWFNLLAVQGTLKSLLQHHSSKASILWCSAFHMVQLSQPYTTKKTMLVMIRNFVGKVTSLLLVTAFLPRSKYLLI